MSIAFSSYSKSTNVNRASALVLPGLPVALSAITGVTQVNSAEAIALGLAAATEATIQLHGSNLVIDLGLNYPVGNLTATLQNLALNWWVKEPEAARRLIIDQIVSFVLHSGGAAFNRLGVYVEKNLSEEGTAGQITAADQTVGHGPLDYLVGYNAVGSPAPSNRVGTSLGLVALGKMVKGRVTAPIFGNTYVIEAKKSLTGVKIDQAAWQLFAQLARTRQLRAAGGQRFFRGALSDGIRWRFYEFDSVGQQLQRSETINITAGVPATGFTAQNVPTTATSLHYVVYGLSKFFAKINNPQNSAWV